MNNSHFRNVRALIEAAFQYDEEELETIIKNAEPSVLADDIVYVLTSIMATKTDEEKEQIKEYLLSDISQYETDQMEFYFGDNEGTASEE